MEAAEGEGALIIMAGKGANGTASNNMETMETTCFDVFDTVPLTPLQSLPRVRPPQLE